MSAPRSRHSRQRQNRLPVPKWNTSADPVLYLKDPDGVSTNVRRQMLHGLGELNRLRHAQIGDPETLARIEQYEMAFRMQSSVPEMADLSSEPDSTFERWGEEAKQAGKCQNAALMARRLVERGVRFVQIYHCGWDVHSFAPEVLARAGPGCRPRGLGPHPGPQGARAVRRDPIRQFQAVLQ